MTVLTKPTYYLFNYLINLYILCYSSFNSRKLSLTNYNDLFTYSFSLFTLLNSFFNSFLSVLNMLNFYFYVNSVDIFLPQS